MATPGLRQGSAPFRRAQLAMLAVGLAVFNSMYATQALLPTLSAELDVAPSTAALTVSATTGALALFVVPFSILSEKYGRGRIIILSSLAATALGVALPLAQSAGQLIALRALQGAMIAGTPATAMAWLAEELDERDLAGAMGLYIAGNTIGGLSGRLIPAVALEVASWRWALMANSVVALALALAASALLPRQRRFVPKESIRPGAELRSIAAHLANPRLLGLYATAFIGMGVFVSLYNYFGYRAIGHFGLPPALAGLVFVMYLSGTWSSARAGVYVGRFGRGRVVLAGAALMLAGVLVTASATLGVALAGLLVFTASFFAMHSTASGWVGRIPERDRAEASSLYVFCYYMGSSIVGAATGAAFEALPWAGFTALLGGLLALLVAVAAALAAADKRS
ncbi:MFS transporter [Corynebacterium timonense]|uniref:MFS transporter, YNFM family, putative membrane transport protein n=1 Tax=Corynebacterium timonense TaxID=441500 RepID=A0A1H1UZ20_9CORY|nr:MFS transporter [Corynebacterium timonense]SDS77139.1 MFS transporter, YNFM family, putative membrane transport protein [Corynebacterium timonense]